MMTIKNNLKTALSDKSLSTNGKNMIRQLSVDKVMYSASISDRDKQVLNYLVGKGYVECNKFECSGETHTEYVIKTEG